MITMLLEALAAVLLLPAAVHGFRLPRWLESPPFLLNIPFAPATDIGNACRVGDRIGDCRISTNCLRSGESIAGSCTPFKSVCCIETGSCNSTVRSATAYAVLNSRQPGQCSTTVQVTRSNICYIRVSVEKAAIRGCKKNWLRLAGNMDHKYRICGDISKYTVTVPVSDAGKVTARLDVGSELTLKMEQLPCPSPPRSPRDLSLSRRLGQCETDKSGSSTTRRRRSISSRRYSWSRTPRRRRRTRRSPFLDIFKIDWGQLFRRHMRSLIQERSQEVEEQGKQGQQGQQREAAAEKEKQDIELEEDKSRLAKVMRRKGDVPDEFFHIATSSQVMLSPFSDTAPTTRFNRKTAKILADKHSQSRKAARKGFKLSAALDQPAVAKPAIKTIADVSAQHSAVLELYRKPVCPAALVSPSQALVPAYCLPAPSPAAPLSSLSVRASGRASVTRVDQLPQLALLSFSPYLEFQPDCRTGPNAEEEEEKQVVVVCQGGCAVPGRLLPLARCEGSQASPTRICVKYISDCSCQCEDAVVMSRREGGGLLALPHYREPACTAPIYRSFVPIHQYTDIILATAGQA